MIMDGNIALFGYLIYTICVSIVLSIVYIRTDFSLFSAMLVHAACNWTLGLTALIRDQIGLESYCVCFIAMTCIAAWANWGCICTKIGCAQTESC